MDTAVHFPTTPQAVKASALALNKRTSVGQAFQAIARSCIAQIAGNAPGVTRFHDVESLHQMRVGLRRLRAALAMFDDVLHAPGDIETELDWLMGQLGPARDWDVLLASTLAQASRAMPREAKLAALKSAVQERVNTLHAQAAGAVASPRFDNLLATLTHWVDQRGWREGLSPKGERRCRQPVADFADAALENEQQRLVKRGRQLKGGDAVQLHRMRIVAVSRQADPSHGRVAGRAAGRARRAERRGRRPRFAGRTERRRRGPARGKRAGCRLPRLPAGAGGGGAAQALEKIPAHRSGSLASVELSACRATLYNSPLVCRHRTMDSAIPS
jgi:CHAD domain-containing protein